MKDEINTRYELQLDAKLSQKHAICQMYAMS